MIKRYCFPQFFPCGLGREGALSSFKRVGLTFSMIKCWSSFLITCWSSLSAFPSLHYLTLDKWLYIASWPPPSWGFFDMNRLHYLFYISLIECLQTTIMDKSLGTLLRFWGVYQFTQVQPLPSPHKQCWTRVSRIFPSFNFA